MKEIQVQFAARFIERQWSTAIGKSLLKTLTEPITNSDDSYRRMTESDPQNQNVPFPITIYVNRRQRIVQIVDQAQGMTFSELEKKFEEYGAAKSGAYEGYSSRGLFGQGISDVLFYHKKGAIKSIKNGEASICSFYKKNGKPYISLERYVLSAKQAAVEWKINGSHGTTVEFTVDDDTPIHDFANLVKKLGSFYMLRLINANDARRVEIVYKDTRETKTAVITYTFPQGEFVGHKEFTFEIDGFDPVKVDAELYKSINPLSANDEDRESGLLVYDDKQAIYDQTFFGLENLRGADKYFGTMKLTGARNIILARINDDKHPEAILTDSRDGFDKQKDFYKQLSLKVKDWLYPILNEEGKRRTDEGISASTKEKHRQALDELNKLYAELTGDDNNGTIKKPGKGRPVGGIEFARNNITVTEGKQYGLQLIVDTNVISPGSKITLISKKRQVTHTPRTITVSDAPEGKNGIFVKTVLLRGKKAGDADTIEALWEKHRASVVISVVPEEIIYPENGMSFSPDYMRTAHGRKSTLHLYVDTSVIKPSSVIAITSSNNSIGLEKNTVTVPKPKKGNITSIGIDFLGNKDSESSIIEALQDNLSCQCRVDIKDHTPPPPKNNSGKFKDWIFDDALPRSRQTTYDDIPGSATQGYILISSSHPINKRYFGDEPSKISVEQSHTAQLYLAELILNESLSAIVAELHQKGFIPNNYGPAIDIPVFIAQKKYEMGSRIYNYFVEDAPKKGDTKREDKLMTAQTEQAVTESEFLDNLEDRSRLMIEMYFGRGEQRQHTLEEIAAKSGITRERVRQIINKALAPKSAERDDEDNDYEEEADTRDYIREEEKRLMSESERIIDESAHMYDVTTEDLFEHTRRAGVVIPRQIAMYLLRVDLGLSFPSIGRKFDRDHTTVIHGCNKVKEMIKKNLKVRNRVQKIRDRIQKT